MFLTKHFVCPLTFCTTIGGGDGEGAQEGVMQGMPFLVLLLSYFLFSIYTCSDFYRRWLLISTGVICIGGGMYG